MLLYCMYYILICFVMVLSIVLSKDALDPKWLSTILYRGDKSLVPHLKTIVERMSAFHRIMLHAQAKQDIEVAGCPSKVSRVVPSL